MANILGYFKRAPGSREASEIRGHGTKDMVRRVGVLSPERVFLNNYPVRNPVAVFNASVVKMDDFLNVYARVVLGYYMYVSAVVRISIPVHDILDGDLAANHYASDIILSPSTRYDVWGVEDPRAYRLGDRVLVSYSGRTINYFNPAVRKERTLIITAVRVKDENGREEWRKVSAHVFPGELRDNLISDKNGFLAEMGGSLWLFHRPHISEGKEEWFLLTASKPVDWTPEPGELRESTVSEPRILMEPAKFEIKLGWGTPLIRVGGGRYVTLVHGVDRVIEAYRVAAVEVEATKGEVVVSAVTPKYIMGPREKYEVFGDRPLVVFPCGMDRLEGDTYVVTYGAADFFVGFGLIDLQELLGELDKGRIY